MKITKLMNLPSPAFSVECDAGSAGTSQGECLEIEIVLEQLRHALRKIKVENTALKLSRQQFDEIDENYLRFEKSVRAAANSRSEQESDSHIQIPAEPECSQLKAHLLCAREIISWYGIASTAQSFAPFSALTANTGLFGDLAFMIVNCLGHKCAMREASDMARRLLQLMGSEMAAVLPDLAAARMAASGSYLANPSQFEACYIKYRRNYRRTVIFGELALEYVLNGFKWGYSPLAISIKNAKIRAEHCYINDFGNL